MPKTVLIVSGDSDTREIVRVLLRHHGYVTREFLAVEDAVSYATADPPALFAGEMWMPAASGFSCLPERVRAESSLAGSRVLVLTADAFEGIEQRARASGADGVMTKPFELPALIREVNRLIGPPVSARPATERMDEGQLGA